METAGSSPKPFMDTLKGAGCLVILPKIPDSRFAHTAQEVGCDARYVSWGMRGAATRAWPGWAPWSSGP